MTQPRPRQIFWNGVHVPYIAPWEGEWKRPDPIVLRRGRGGEGIGYANEQSHVDRRHGVLWVRYGAVRGTGEPKLAGVHPLRQRQVLVHMLCQVCGGSTFGRREDERHLFLRAAKDGRPIEEGERTTTPPVCEPCATESVRWKAENGNKAA